MKNKDLKKGKESIIGKIIYGFLLFMPLLAILSTILYTTFNKNAYQSYYGENINEESINYLLPTDMVKGNEYYYSNNILSYGYNNDRYTYIVDDFNLISTTSTFTTHNIDKIEVFYNQSGSSDYIPFIRFYEGVTEYTYRLNTFTFNFSFILINLSENNQNATSDLFNFYEIIYNKNSFLSDSFYYAVDRVENSPLFSWATNSLIYTGIANTCTQLSITTTFIPLLLAYWLIISVIYILYDIILMILIILHNKIHRLQESI